MSFNLPNTAIQSIAKRLSPTDLGALRLALSNKDGASSKNPFKIKIIRQQKQPSSGLVVQTIFAKYVTWSPMPFRCTAGIGMNSNDFFLE